MSKQIPNLPKKQTHPHMPRLRISGRSIAAFLTIICLSGNLTACLSGYFPGVYRIDIPQGNLIDPDKLEEVKIGMEPRQVHHLLGTPLLTDSFNDKRWDYFYSITKGLETTVKHHASIFFENGRVSEVLMRRPPMGH